MIATEEFAFPTLTESEMSTLLPYAERGLYAEGDELFRAGQADVDLFVVEKGAIEIRNPLDSNRVVTVHQEREFTGDIDLLTGRPVVVTGVAACDSTLLRIPSKHLRMLLNRIPSFSEKLINAFTVRRDLLVRSGRTGLQVVGFGACKDTNLVREFLHKNFVPFEWIEPAEEGDSVCTVAMRKHRKSPIIVCGDGREIVTPSLAELGKLAGVWKSCIEHEQVDFAIVGAGPAGLTAAVYAASEGINTLVLDKLGPGGQAAGSSRIENFIGFPSGLSGQDLAARSVIQLLKFGARMVAPVNVTNVEVTSDEERPIQLQLDGGSIVSAKVVLLAMGVCWRKLEVPRIERFESAGIHYVCTAVEADLYDRADVAVVGAGNSAGQAAMFLSECCRERTVHMIIRNELGPGMSEYLEKRIRSAPNIVLHEHSEISELVGKHMLESIVIQEGRDGKEASLPCKGVFVFIGAVPSGDFLPDSVARDEQGYVLTGVDVLRSGRWPLKDRDPHPLETSLPRVLAAGDLRAGSTKRVGFAVGDGAMAVTCMHRLVR